NNGQAVSQLEYSRVIRCLMYAITCTRLDIDFAVGKQSRYTSNPSTQHWQAIQRASKKQTYITISIMESEYMALAAAGKEAEWLRNVILEILLWFKSVAPISFYYDNAATLAMAYSKIYNGKPRHLGFRHSMIHELIMNRVVYIEFARDYASWDSGKMHMGRSGLGVGTVPVCVHVQERARVPRLWNLDKLSFIVRLFAENLLPDSDFLCGF
nr:hypothetical protein [Tanacetum cinerariifolium]